MSAETLTPPIIRFRFRNPGDNDLTLWIEPLGDEVAIPKHSTVEIHCTDQLGPNELEMSSDGLTVHGWVRSVFAVSKDGRLHSLWAWPEGQ